MTYDQGVYTVTLFRETKVVYELTGYMLTWALESTASSYREKVVGPSYDDMLYFLMKWDYEEGPTYIWLSKEEYWTLLPMWNDILKKREEEEDANEECDYCHGPVGRCGGSCRDRDLYY